MKICHKYFSTDFQTYRSFQLPFPTTCLLIPALLQFYIFRYQLKCCILVCSTFHGFFFLKFNSLRSRAGQFRRKSNENEITCHMCHMIDHMINVINMPERIIEKLKLTCNLKNLPGVPFYNCTRVWLLDQVLLRENWYFILENGRNFHKRRQFSYFN